MSIVYIGIGSNLGQRKENIQRAIFLLEKQGNKILKTSTIIETEPVGGPPQGKFLNAVIKIETSLQPLDLLKVLQTIEQQLGRVRTIPNAARTIDLDILLYDKISMQTPELIIPHPRIFEREFVLKPFKEIAAEIFKGNVHAHC